MNVADVRQGHFESSEGTLLFLVVDGIASRAVSSKEELDKLLPIGASALRPEDVAPTFPLPGINGHKVAGLLKGTNFLAVQRMNGDFLGVVDGMPNAVALAHGEYCERLDFGELTAYEPPQEPGNTPGRR